MPPRFLACNRLALKGPMLRRCERSLRRTFGPLRASHKTAKNSKLTPAHDKTYLCNRALFRLTRHAHVCSALKIIFHRAKALATRRTYKVQALGPGFCSDIITSVAAFGFDSRATSGPTSKCFWTSFVGPGALVSGKPVNPRRLRGSSPTPCQSLPNNRGRRRRLRAHSSCRSARGVDLITVSLATMIMPGAILRRLAERSSNLGRSQTQGELAGVIHIRRVPLGCCVSGLQFDPTSRRRRIEGSRVASPDSATAQPLCSSKSGSVYRGRFGARSSTPPLGRSLTAPTTARTGAAFISVTKPCTACALTSVLPKRSPMASNRFFWRG